MMGRPVPMPLPTTWPSGRRYHVLLTLSLAASAGCVHYQARPIVPEQLFERWDGRTLADAGLAHAVEPGHLAATWPPDTWDLPSLTAAALYFHSELALARASWAVARAGRISAGERPNLGLTAGPGFNASTPANTITPWILNFDLDFTVETAGKRGFRLNQATALAGSARYRIADAAWGVRAGVRQALVDLFAATETAGLLDQQQQVLGTSLVLFQRQLDAGEISAFQMSQARLQLATLRVSVADSRRQQQDARARLATAIGLPAAAIEDTRFNYDVFRRTPVDIPDAAARRQAVLNRADVLGALSDYDASQAALQLEIARQYPDLHLGPGYQMDQDSNKWSLLFPLSLPVFSRNQGRIAEAEARRSLAAAQVEALQARTLGAIDRALVAYRAALARIGLADQLLLDAQRVEDVARNQFSAGAISQLDLSIVELDVMTRALVRLEAGVQAQQALGDLENAMQRPADMPLTPLPGEPQ